ncbi:MAG TPA: hypothetical protein PKI30_07650 [Bacillota bacterium]|jgi:uncharacterized protein YggU (UPF0235/DUF167 family)|nr:hypothetical protein [Bacillota bacterium]
MNFKAKRAAAEGADGSYGSGRSDIYIVEGNQQRKKLVGIRI